MSEIKCPLCGFAEQAPDGEDCCPRCGTRLAGGEGEKKLLEASGTFTTEDKQFFGKMSTSASIYLTDRRLLAIPEKLEGFNLRTGLTAAAVNKMTGQYGAISIPVSYTHLQPPPLHPPKRGHPPPHQGGDPGGGERL